MQRWRTAVGLCLAAPLLGWLLPGRAAPSPPRRVEWSHAVSKTVDGPLLHGARAADGALVSALVVDGRPVVIRYSAAL